MGYTLTRASAPLFAGVVGILLYAACSMDPGDVVDESANGDASGASSTGGGSSGSSGTTGSSGTSSGVGSSGSSGVGSSGVGSSGVGSSGVGSSGVGSSGVGSSGVGSSGVGSSGVGSSGGSSSGVVSTDDPTCTSYSAPVVSVVTPIGQAATQLVGTMSQQNELDLMSNAPSCADYTDPKCPFHSQGTTVNGTTIANYEMRDGPRGVRGTEWNQQSTTWAVAEARAASFDTALEYQVGLAHGQEMKALGNDLALAPVVNTLRNPLWARAQETYGEDPVLLGEMGAAFTNGLQKTVAACVKHFVGNDTDNNRMTANALENEQILRENYTRPFEIVIKKADPACVMAAYNEVNGTHCTENSHLLTDILRTAWGWTGFVVSDWGASIPGDGAKSVNAGLDLEMPFRANSFYALPTGVTAAQITQAATRIVNARSVFNDFAGNAAGTLNPNIVTDATHISVAKQTEEEGAVLLKNSGVLPFGATVKSIAVVGPDYQRPIAPTAAQNGSGPKGSTPFVSGLGDRGSSQTVPPHAISFLQGIQTRAGSGITVTSSADASAGAGANVIVVPVTMAHEDEGEAYGGGADRVDLTLTDVHPIHWGTPKPTAFINTLRTTYPNAKIVVLLAVGSAIVMEDWMASADAIVQTFYPGQEGGTAVAELLFGDINFSGKLPFTVSMNPSGFRLSRVPEYLFADDGRLPSRVSSIRGERRDASLLVWLWTELHDVHVQ